MASTKTQMIEAIRTAVLAIPEIGSFRGFNGQFDDNKQHPLEFPCVLWEITNIPWITRPDNRGGSLQYTTDAEIVFHIGVRSFGDDPNVDDEIFEWADQVAAVIQAITGDEFGRFERINETMDTQHDHVVDHMITFKFGISDCLTFAKSDNPKTATLKTLQQHGDIQDTPADASINFNETPQHGTDDPND